MLQLFGWLICSLCLLVSSCSRYPLPNEHDPYSGKVRKEYEDILSKPKIQNAKTAKKKKPKLSRPKPALDAKFYTKVSFQISEKVSLKEAISNLCKQVGVDLEMVENPEMALTFSASNTAFIDIIKRITRLVRWRYHLDGDCLRLEKDTPFLKNYNIQFLSFRRESKDSVSVATKLLNTDSGISVNNGSDTAIQSTTTSDFWEELCTSLNVILMDEPHANNKQPFAIHKQAGILSIYATSQKHEVIQAYLKKLRTMATAQVLIEAKVVEVTLKNEYRSGINWSFLKDIAGGNFSLDGLYGGVKNAQEGLLMKASKDQMSSVFNLIDKFGTTRTLSSPRLTVMNNQPAILKVVENHVYFNVRYDTYHHHSKTPQHNPEPFTNIQSQVQTVPIGLILTVQPSIDIETGEIVMALRPTISSRARGAKDPAVELAAKKLGHDIVSEIPVIKIDEINSVLRIDDDMVILGGMMQEVVTDNQNGLPGLTDNPISGLISDKQDTRRVKELVIFLRAVRLDEENSTIDTADERLLENFVTDPRP